MTPRPQALRRPLFPLARPARHVAVVALALATAVVQAAGPAGRKLYPTELFNYAEKQYPALFPTHAANQSLPPYVYRQYGSGNYLGLASDTVYLLGPASGGAIQAVGTADAFYCAVVPNECSKPPVTLNGRPDMLSVAAYGADSLFMYQTVINSLVFDVLNLLAPTPVTGTPSTPLAGVRTLPCNADGSGTYTVTDADNSRTLTPGDRLSIVANNCVIGDPATKSRFTGDMTITIASGSNTHNYWASQEATGGIELSVDMRSMKTQRGLFSGAYRYATAWPAKEADYTETTSFDDLKVTVSDATIQYADVKLFFTQDAAILSKAEGAVIINDFELGLVRTQLSVRTVMNVDQSTIRPRPTSGALRVSGYGFNVDLNFLGNRRIDLTGDNGADGSNEITMSVTESNLDGYLVP